MRHPFRLIPDQTEMATARCAKDVREGNLIGNVDRIVAMRATDLQPTRAIASGTRIGRLIGRRLVSFGLPPGRFDQPQVVEPPASSGIRSACR